MLTPPQYTLPMNVESLKNKIGTYQSWLDDARAACADPDFPWYRYGSLSNFTHLDNLLTGANRSITELAGGQTIVDIGAADGDTAFALAKEGFHLQIVDHAATNMNGLRGARLLNDFLKLGVSIHDVNLDAQFQLPEQRYGLAIFLGILYHLKNPYLVLENLAQRAQHAIVSTRIARFIPTQASGVAVDKIALAYLLDAGEANGDATNYWIFSEAGLRRIFHRTGWDVIDFMLVGDLAASNPIENNHDERAFALLRSRVS